PDMRVHIGTDHAGFELKNRLGAGPQQQGHEVTDHGAHEYDAPDDYAPFCTDVGEAVGADAGPGGIVVGGSGSGEQIAASTVAGGRAALGGKEDTAGLARQHKDANVSAVGARQHSEEELEALIDLFLAEPFTGEERHQRRIDLVGLYERTGGYGTSAAQTAD